MFKPIRWKTLPRDFIVIQIGFAFFGLAIACLIQANLGTSPWVMLTVAISNITNLSPGVITQLIGVAVLTIALAMREQIGWGTLANILFIGLWIDIFLKYIPQLNNNWPIQLLLLLAAVVFLGMGSAIYIGVDAGAGPRDSLMLSITRKFDIPLRRARGGIELCVFIVAWLMGGPAGIGTIIFAVLIGSSVQMAFKLFKVQQFPQVKYDIT